MGLISAGFMLFTLWTSNPFLRLIPAAQDGADLNPVLQDFALAIHPPMLYTGYVGFSVAFAFACAAMLEGRLDQAWAKWTRPWTIFAWIFQTIGIALGSWWAYYELGWGGWWFWDPVENASFMPWLVGTALIHSLARHGEARHLQELDAAARDLRLLLEPRRHVPGALGRAGLGALVRDRPEARAYILAFLVITIGGSLALYAWRAPKLYVPGGFELFSREFFLLVNNVILVSVAGLVLWGTLSPLVYELLEPRQDLGGPAGVRRDVPGADAAAHGVSRHRHAFGLAPRQAHRVGEAHLVAARRGAVLSLAVQGVGFGKFHWVGLVGFMFGFWIIFSALIEPVQRLRQRPEAHGGLARHGDRARRRRHVRDRRERRRELQDRKGRGAEAGHRATSIAGYDFHFVSAVDVTGPNYDAVRGAGRGHPRRQAGDDPEAGEAPFLGAANRQQPGGDLRELVAGSVRRDGQSARRGSLEHAHPIQAAGALHLAGSVRDGGRRRGCRDRPPLPRARERRPRRDTVAAPPGPEPSLGKL